MKLSLILSSFVLYTCTILGQPIGGGTTVPNPSQIVNVSSVSPFSIVTVTGYVYNSDTNHIVVTNTPGVAAVQDTYKYSKNYIDISEGVVGIFTNNAGTYGILISQNQDSWSGHLTNGAGSLIYSTTDGTPVGNQWDGGDSGSGSAPYPYMNYGPTAYTQNQIQPNSAYSPMPTLGTNLYVNSYTGNNTFAMRGRMDLPYKTLSFAINSASPYDTIYIESGVYNETIQPVGDIVGLKIIGSSRDSVIITGQKEFRLGNSNYVANLTTDWTFTTGATYGSPVPRTNCVIANIRGYGGSDAAYWIPYGGGAWNCEFTGNNDIFAFPAIQSYMTNSDAAFKIMNCSLKPASGVGAGLSLQGYANIHMNGGEIKCGSGGRVVGGANGGAPTYSTNTIVICNGVLLIAPASGQLATMASGNGVQILTNNCVLRLEAY